VIVSRADWQDPNCPVTGPVSTPDEWQWNTLHWPGGNCGSDGPSVLRSMQASWVSSKGYSLGYNFAVWPDGTAYEIRGFDLRCAANGDQTVNRPGVAILLAVPDVDTAPTEAMTAAVRELVGATRALVGQTLIVNAHRDVRPEPTQCCGDVIVGMIAAGVFEPTSSTPTPTPEDDDMAALAYYRDDRPDGWQIWVVAVDGHGQAWTCPIGDLPDGGKWDKVQPIVGDPPVRPFGALVGLMDAQNRPAP
jgi:hypothetical protein